MLHSQTLVRGQITAGASYQPCDQLPICTLALTSLLSICKSEEGTPTHTPPALLSQLRVREGFGQAKLLPSAWTTTTLKPEGLGFEPTPPCVGYSMLLQPR